MTNNFSYKRCFAGKENSLIVFALLLALIGPFFLLPLEKTVGFDWFIEESYKLIIVLILFLVIDEKFLFLVLTFLVGLFFSLSENFLYLSNFIFSGITKIFWDRFFLTSLLHIGTTLLMGQIIFFKRIFFLIAVLVGFLLHYFFNNYFL